MSKNIFGMVNKAFEAAKDNDGTKFSFVDVEKAEADAIVALVINSFSMAIQLEYSQNPLSLACITNVQELESFIEDIKHLGGYNQDNRTLTITLPIEKVEGMQGTLGRIHCIMFSEILRQKTDLKLPDGEENIPGYIWRFADEGIDIVFYDCLQNLALSHGFKEAVSVLEGNEHNPVVATQGMLDAIARVENLDLPKGRNSKSQPSK